MSAEPKKKLQIEREGNKPEGRKSEGRKSEGRKPDLRKSQGEKKTYPLTEEEKVAQAKITKLEKSLEDAQAKVKDIMMRVRDKESTRNKIWHTINENRDAIKKIHEQMEEKRSTQKEAYGKAQAYIEALRKRKHRRADERAELLKLLPKGAELPPLREEEEGAAAGGVSDYDRAIKIVHREMERIRLQHSTSISGTADDKRMIGFETHWNNVIERIKELERNAAAPLADLAEVDVMGCLETCRKLKVELDKLQASCIPHYNAIAEAFEKLEENRAGVPKLLQERNTLFAEVKELVAKLAEANFEMDKARYKAQKARNQKRREDALKESAEIKARNEEFKKRREARIEKAMNTLPHEREVVAAKELLSYLRTVALPGTCGTSESAAPKPKVKAQPTMTSAPAVELEEASFGATEIVVSRKSQPAGKVAKKQNKKKKPAGTTEAPKAEPKKKTPEDPVTILPMYTNRFEILSLQVPETYGEVEARYNEIKEKLEGYEKVRAEIKEQREKSLQEAEKKALEEAEKKKEEQLKEKEEEAKPAEESAEKPADEAAAAEAPAATEEPAAEAPAESQ